MKRKRDFLTTGRNSAFQMALHLPVTDDTVGAVTTALCLLPLFRLAPLF